MNEVAKAFKAYGIHVAPETEEASALVRNHIAMGEVPFKGLLGIFAEYVPPYALFENVLDAARAAQYLNFLVSIPEENIPNAIAAFTEMEQTINRHRLDQNYHQGETSWLTLEPVTGIDGSYNIYANVSGMIRLMLEEKIITHEEAQAMAAGYNYHMLTNLSDKELGIEEPSE